MFLETVQPMINGIFQLFLISAAAGFLVRKKIVTKAQVTSLSGVTVTVFLPCLIIAKTVTRFDPSAFVLWWTLPLAGILLILTGLFWGMLLLGRKPEKRILLPLASMQNAVYIVLPIGQILYPDQFDLFALYCFLMVMGITPLMWSVGKVLITGRKDTRIRWQDFITPPFAATLISILIVFSGLSSLLPTALIASMDLLGQATVPLAIFILGATLGTISFVDMPPMKDILIVSGIKFVLVPLTVFGVLYIAGLNRSVPLFCSLMMIQASSPPATNLILMVENYGGDTQSVSSMMMLQYLLCILAMPFWLALWQAVVG